MINCFRAASPRRRDPGLIYESSSRVMWVPEMRCRVVERPDHDLTIRHVFRIYTRDRHEADKLLAIPRVSESWKELGEWFSSNGQKAVPRTRANPELLAKPGRYAVTLRFTWSSGNRVHADERGRVTAASRRNGRAPVATTPATCIAPATARAPRKATRLSMANAANGERKQQQGRTHERRAPDAAVDPTPPQGHLSLHATHRLRDSAARARGCDPRPAYQTASAYASR